MLLFYLSLINTEEEKRCFEHIYLTYRHDMFKLANSLLKNEADAEDAVGDVFVKIASKHMSLVTGIKSDVDLRNYLLKATKNTVLNIIERHSTKNLSLDAITENGVCPMPELTDDSFLDRILTKIECDKVIEAINNLSDTYRDVLYEHFVIGASISVIASNSGKSIATVKKQLQRGKKLLLASLENKKEDENNHDQRRI